MSVSVPPWLLSSEVSCTMILVVSCSSCIGLSSSGLVDDPPSVVVPISKVGDTLSHLGQSCLLSVVSNSSVRWLLDALPGLEGVPGGACYIPCVF